MIWFTTVQSSGVNWIPPPLFYGVLFNRNYVALFCGSKKKSKYLGLFVILRYM